MHICINSYQSYWLTILAYVSLYSHFKSHVYNIKWGLRTLVFVVDGVVNKNSYNCRGCSSIDNFDNDTVSPILKPVVAKRLRWAGKEDTFKHEGTKTAELFISSDSPAVVWPVAGMLRLGVICPTLRVALIELALIC